MAVGPNVAGDTAVTDPVHLGIMWFVRPLWPLTLLPPLLHFLAGLALGLSARVIPPLWPRTAALVAVGVNGAATALENAYGMGVMGVGGWLLGSFLSALLMFIGIACVGWAVRRTAPG